MNASVRQISAIENFANFQRFLAPPKPSPDTPGGSTSIARGRQQFTNVGCALCHTPALKTGNTTVAALATRPPICSPTWRFTPWGQDSPTTSSRAGPGATSSGPPRCGASASASSSSTTAARATSLEAIRAHRSDGNSKFGPSEANAVIEKFNRLDEHEKQDLLNFLRSL